MFTLISKINFTCGSNSMCDSLSKKNIFQSKYLFCIRTFHNTIIFYEIDFKILFYFNVIFNTTFAHKKLIT